MLSRPSQQDCQYFADPQARDILDLTDSSRNTLKVGFLRSTSHAGPLPQMFFGHQQVNWVNNKSWLYKCLFRNVQGTIVYTQLDLYTTFWWDMWRNRDMHTNTCGKYDDHKSQHWCHHTMIVFIEVQEDCFCLLLSSKNVLLLVSTLHIAVLFLLQNHQEARMPYMPGYPATRQKV